MLGTLSHNTALVITLPDELVERVQAIRRELDTHHVDIWPPHITLMYPFYLPNQLQQAIELLQTRPIAPFKIALNKFGHFSQGKKGFVTWLNPEPNRQIQDLHKALSEVCVVQLCDSQLYTCKYVEKVIS